MPNLIEDAVRDHLQVTQSFFSRHQNLVARAAREIAKSFERGGKLMLFGNGGSAADAQHIAAEFVNRFVDDREALPALALTTDSSALTSIANDYEYERIFSRQIEALGRRGDIALGITTSGNSANVIRAFELCKERSIRTIGLLGKDGGRAKALCDVPIIVESNVTARIQEVHIIIGHLITGLCEEFLHVEAE